MKTMQDLGSPHLHDGAMMYPVVLVTEGEGGSLMPPVTSPRRQVSSVTKLSWRTEFSWRWKEAQKDEKTKMLRDRVYLAGAWRELL